MVFNLLLIRELRRASLPQRTSIRNRKKMFDTLNLLLFTHLALRNQPSSSGIINTGETLWTSINSALT